MTVSDAKVLARSIAKQYTWENQPLGFWILDVEGIERAAARWKKNLPNVWPQYAIKANALPEIVNAYGQLGFGYDCASIAEIKEVVDLGFPVERCIYAHTLKTFSELIEAERMGVTRATVDSIYEVEKMAKCSPKMGVVIRIKCDDPTSTFKLGDKFGMRQDEIEPVIQKCKELNMNITGIAFHVGCDSHSADAFRIAITLMRETYSLTEKYGFHPTFMDIGGGFSHYTNFEEFAKTINDTIEEMKFPADCKFAAEPGRFFAQESMHLCLSCHAKRIRKFDDKMVHEYAVGDGIHGALAYCMMWNRQVPCESLYDKEGPVYSSTFYGPSCNGGDKFSQSDCPDLIPGEDWVFVPKCGCYSMVIATNFNGYCCRDHKVYRLDDPKSKLTFNIPEKMLEGHVPVLRGHGPVV